MVACSTGRAASDPCIDRPGRLYLYDDSMYAYYPAKQLPMVDTTVEPTFANGIRFEVRCPHHSCCARLVTRLLTSRSRA